MVCVCVLVALGLSAVARGSLRHTAVCLSHVRFLQTTLSTDTCGVKEALGGLEIRTLAASFVFYIPLVRFPGAEGGMTKSSSFPAPSSPLHRSFATPPPHPHMASLLWYGQYRDLCLAGGVCDASRFSARSLLDSGKSILLVPGGLLFR
jgi:hypothetical protein